MGKRFYSNNSSKWCPLTGRFYWVSAFNLYTYGADKLDFLFKAFTRQSLCRRTHNINSFHRVNKPVRSYKTSFIRVCFKDDVISRCVSFHLCVCVTWGLSLQYVAVKGSNQMGAKLTGAERSWRLCENFRNIFRIVFLFFYHHWDCLGCEIISLYLRNMAIKSKKKKHSACISTPLTHRHSCTVFASFSDSSGGWSTLGNAFFQLQLFYLDKVRGSTLADWPGILGCPHYSRKLMDSDLRLFWGRTSVLACWTRSPWY